MHSSSIAIIQTEYTILQKLPEFAEYMKDTSSYFELYNEFVLCLVSLPIFQRDIPKYIELSEKHDLDIQLSKLNTFAKNRLVINFEKDYPELALRVMSCGDDSSMVKIKRNNKC